MSKINKRFMAGNIGFFFGLAFIGIPTLSAQMLFPEYALHFFATTLLVGPLFLNKIIEKTFKEEL